MRPDRQRPEPQSALEALFAHSDTIRFIYWDRVSGAKPAVYLTGLVAIAAFITGLSHLSQNDLTLEGPLTPVVPVTPASVQFVAVLIAFVLAVMIVGLNRRKRVAWYGVVSVLPIAGVLALVTFQSTDLPLLVLVVVSLIQLGRSRHRFDRRLDLSALQIGALASIAAVLAYATVGSYALREQFANIETWGDATYYVIVTIATVGYGDITPLTTQAQWFSLSVIVLGTAAFTAAIGTFFVPLIEKRMAAAVGTMTPDLTLLEDHFLVLGYSEMTESMIQTMEAAADGDFHLVVITHDSETASVLDDSIDVLVGDPTDTAVLRTASIDTARGVVVATEDDAQDILSIIAVRQTNPDVRVVAAATEHHHLDKLEAVGADEVISPMLIAGRQLGSALLNE